MASEINGFIAAATDVGATLTVGQRRAFFKLFDRFKIQLDDPTALSALCAELQEHIQSAYADVHDRASYPINADSIRTSLAQWLYDHGYTTMSEDARDATDDAALLTGAHTMLTDTPDASVTLPMDFTIRAGSSTLRATDAPSMELMSDSFQGTMVIVGRLHTTGTILTGVGWSVRVTDTKVYVDTPSDEQWVGTWASGDLIVVSLFGESGWVTLWSDTYDTVDELDFTGGGDCTVDQTCLQTWVSVDVAYDTATAIHSDADVYAEHLL